MSDVDPPILSSADTSFNILRIVLLTRIYYLRKGPFAYSPQAAEVTQRLWKETMQELSFANVQAIVKDLSAK